MTSPILQLALILVLGSSCNNRPNLAEETKAILVLHDEQRKAHVEKNVALLVNHDSADFTVVNHGLVTKPTKEESTKRFQAYFDAVDFIKWDDVSSPVFSFSDDATMATTIVEKLVITRQKQEGNRLDTVRYAWLAVYKKSNGKWEMDRMASTNQ